ncbi:type IV pilus biogenesis protein PilP [Burkholderia sp. Tr-20390]|uniref:type IV pilus biogenesis protein PilP n=1 Tax=Burkholderia sp. Tr-20390 TaxID=2703904 RepID=UPI001F11AEB3|nr:type IV pilus biogenesis protein PilP [Burkholderia sp. Tr-20390]
MLQLVSVGVLMTVPLLAHADEADNVGTLGKIQTHTYILNAKYLEKQAQDKLDGKIGADGALTPSATASAAPRSVVDSALPNVKMIVNGDAGPSAVLLYAGGIQAAGKVGSKLPGGYTIKAISATNRSVDVTDRSGRPLTLGMSSTPPQLPEPVPQPLSGPTPMRMPMFGAPANPR